MSNRIDFYTNQAGLEAMIRLVDIALEAHGNNPSPVDIKLKLAEMPADQLLQMSEDFRARRDELTPIKKSV